MSDATDPGHAEEIGYADAVAELDAILEELDDDDLDIDLLSARVDRAAHLIRICRSRITSAQDRIGEVLGQLEETPPDGDT